MSFVWRVSMTGMFAILLLFGYAEYQEAKRLTALGRVISSASREGDLTVVMHRLEALERLETANWNTLKVGLDEIAQAQTSAGQALSSIETQLYRIVFALPSLTPEVDWGAKIMQDVDGLQPRQVSP